MCSCEFNFTCARHREPNPDLPDGDDPYNKVAYAEVSGLLAALHDRGWHDLADEVVEFLSHTTRPTGDKEKAAPKDGLS